MNKTSLFISVCVTVFLITTALSAQDRVRVAVLDFTSSNLPEVYASTIRDQIEVSLYKTKNIDLLERNRIALAMKEKNIKESDSRDAESLSRLGRILSATYVITANITCLETCSITIRIIEVSSGRIVYADTQIIPRKDSVDAAVKELSSRLTSFFLTVTPETKTTHSSHPLSLPLSIGYVQPIGDLAHIAKGGISLTTGLYLDNAFFPNLFAGITPQFIYLSGKSDVKKIYMVPVMVSLGYNFNLSPTWKLSPILSSGAAYTYIQKPGLSSGALQNYSALSLDLMYKLTPSFSITLQPQYCMTIEKSGIIEMAGFNVGSNYQF